MEKKTLTLHKISSEIRDFCPFRALNKKYNCTREEYKLVEKSVQYDNREENILIQICPP